mgnify:CR=1 FL=1
MSMLWGWATQFLEKLQLEHLGIIKTIQPLPHRWYVEIQVQTPSAGGPYTITISDGEPVTLTNVLIGEVWLCSGQVEYGNGL